MIRKAFVMRVDSERHDEYRDRHNPIWPDLEQVLKANGVHDYSIYLDAETNSLFAYVEIEDEARWEGIAETDVCRKWWSHMSDLMPSNPDHSPVAKDLKEVLHLDCRTSLAQVSVHYQSARADKPI